MSSQYCISHAAAFETADPGRREVVPLQPHSLGKAEGHWVGCGRAIWQHGIVKLVDYSRTDQHSGTQKLSPLPDGLIDGLRQ